MSGGHYGYVCHKIDDIELQINNNPKRRMFQQLLKLVATAMHDIEWVDSGDYSRGDENEALDAVFRFLRGDAETKAKAVAYDEVVKLVLSKEAK